MPHEGTFQLQTDLAPIAALSLQIKAGENFKYGTYTETRGNDQIIIGQPSNSFQGLQNPKISTPINKQG